LVACFGSVLHFLTHAGELPPLSRRHAKLSEEDTTEVALIGEPAEKGDLVGRKEGWEGDWTVWRDRRLHHDADVERF
jgi:hypothetical protein